MIDGRASQSVSKHIRLKENIESVQWIIELVVPIKMNTSGGEVMDTIGGEWVSGG